jgi:hypothetical protein
VNALAREEVGEYLNTHFFSAYQKVGTFQVDGDQKQGGNVASYFCTPGGSVLHAIAGPVKADVFLREARWVVETWKLAQMETRGIELPLKAFYRKAHRERLRQDHQVDLRRLLRPPMYGIPNIPASVVLKQVKFTSLDNQGRVHLLLCAAPLVRIERVYRLVFERVLNESVSTNPVEVTGKP